MRKLSCHYFDTGTLGNWRCSIQQSSKGWFAAAAHENDLIVTEIDNDLKNPTYAEVTMVSQHFLFVTMLITSILVTKQTTNRGAFMRTDIRTIAQLAVEHQYGFQSCGPTDHAKKAANRQLVEDLTGSKSKLLFLYEVSQITVDNTITVTLLQLMISSSCTIGCVEWHQ